jgi:hypothetical protein
VFDRPVGAGLAVITEGDPRWAQLRLSLTDDEPARSAALGAPRRPRLTALVEWIISYRQRHGRRVALGLTHPEVDHAIAGSMIRNVEEIKDCVPLHQQA